jgi:hypothetical protein
MATVGTAHQAVLDAIEKMAPAVKRPESLLQLAEALAWLRSPEQPHGGNVSKTS